VIGYVLVVSAASSEVLVIGAGVSGLSTALALLQSGLGVTVYAADPPLRTTSAAAGALWGPHLVGADERVGRWAGVTLTRFRALAADPATGIRETAGVAASLTDDAGTGPPEFAVGAGPVARCDPAALPAGYASGWRYTAPVVSMPAYLDYLVDEVLRAGGRLHLGGPLRTLAEAERQFAAPVIVNCAGIGASELVPDSDLIPVRGQLARLIPQSDVTYGLFYKRVSFVPRRDGLVFQAVGDNDYYGFNDDSATPDRDEAERAVNTIASLFAA